MDKAVILITTPDEDTAAKIARALVEEKLAACANIVRGIRSIYSWKGETCDDQECLMVVKSSAANFAALERRVREMHPYEVPEVVQLAITAGSEPYMRWLEENTRIG